MRQRAVRRRVGELGLLASRSDPRQQAGSDRRVGRELHRDRLTPGMRREVDVANRAGGDLDDVEPGRDERAVGCEQPDPHDRVGGPRGEHLQVPFAGPRRYAGEDDASRRCRGRWNPVDAQRVEAADLLVTQSGGDAALAHLDVHTEPRDGRSQRVEQEHLLTARRNGHAPPRRCVDLTRRAVERHVHLRGSGLGVGEVEPAALPDLGTAADEPEVGAGSNARRPGQPAQVATRRTGGLHRREPRCEVVGRFADQRGAACGRRCRGLLVGRGQRDDRCARARETQQLRLAGARRYAVQPRGGHAHLGLRARGLERLRAHGHSPDDRHRRAVGSLCHDGRRRSDQGGDAGPQDQQCGDGEEGPGWALLASSAPPPGRRVDGDGGTGWSGGGGSAAACSSASSTARTDGRASTSATITAASWSHSRSWRFLSS